VLDFHSDIRVQTNGDLVVSERITVLAEGREIRSGIVRDFARLPVEVLRVTRRGQAETWKTERIGGAMRLRIGGADTVLARGEHVYEIVYRSARQVEFLDEHDELTWSVNGAGWTYAFDRLSAEVLLPTKVPAKALKVEARTGFGDIQGKSYQVFTREGAAAFRATRRFASREGMTIVVRFPKGVVAPPPWSERAKKFLGL
jgi:hypothetical protein